MKYLILNYDETLSRHFDITNIFDELVSKYSNDYSFISFEELSNNSNNVEQLQNYFLSKYNNVPKYIIGFCGVGSFLSIYKIVTAITNLVFIIDDIHHAKSVRNARIPVLKSSKIIFSTYAYLYNSNNLPQPEKLYFFPHSARWICDFNYKPINKILISGRISDIYADRVFAHNYALNNPDKFDILKCNVPYKNVNKNDTNAIYGKKFYDFLNMYLCCFVDTTRNYLLAKIFEICASGSLLFCMNPSVNNIMESIGFIDNVNYISCTRDNFHEKVNYILDEKNSNIILNIRKNGYELIINKHQWINRMQFIKDILENDFSNDSIDFINNNYKEYIY